MLTLDILPEEFEEAIRAYERTVVPAARKQRGLKGLLLLTDAGRGIARSITLWERKEDAFDDATYQDLLGVFSEKITVKSYLREEYEVSVHI